MEVMAKISKGTLMDQIYIPKNRTGMETGSYVIIKPIAEKEKKEIKENLLFYNVHNIEPIKIEIVEKIMKIMDERVEYDNIIIFGSFLKEGFEFKDIDVLILTEKEVNSKSIEKRIKKKIGLLAHLLSTTNTELRIGLETDPFYQMIISKCISKKRLIYNTKNKPNYKILDLHLLKSKVLIDSFEMLTGKEKYLLTRNMVAIKIYLANKKISPEILDKEIIFDFKLDSVNEIKDNMLKIRDFRDIYKSIYHKLFEKIMEGIKHESK
ncbi:MAG: hypothetical protein Q7R87_01795 [Nanoarchaeota archaeon]|nr:hypothetical protein [Nanoarchaeota archaeon]